jgi:hypothetical protein
MMAVVKEINSIVHDDDSVALVSNPVDGIVCSGSVEKQRQEERKTKVHSCFLVIEIYTRKLIEVQELR